MATNTFSNIASATVNGSRAITITGSSVDGATAAGYSAFVHSITGRAPSIIQSGRDAVIVLTPDQVTTIQKWIDSQIMRSLLPRKKSLAPPSGGSDKGKLILNTGPVVGPLVLKYGLIIGGALFASGYFLRGAIK